MVTISLRFEDDVKRELEQMCREMGMNLTTFFTIYAHAALREKRIPFEVRANGDAFYTKENVGAILRSKKEAHQGKVVRKTLAELRAMENE